MTDLRQWIRMVEATGTESTLILVSRSGKAETFQMTFRDFIKQHNLPHIGSLVDAGNLWCNASIMENFKSIQIYWKTVTQRQIIALQKTLYAIGMTSSDRCDVNANGQRLSTTVGRIQPPVVAAARRPSKQLQAAEQIDAEVLDDDLAGNTLSRVVWERSRVIETHDLSVVGLTDQLGEYPGIYALHVGDPDFWFHKLIDDYGHDAHAFVIDITPAKGDVLVKDVQYAIPDEAGNKGYSAILLTTRRILREGKDFRYDRELSDEI